MSEAMEHGPAVGATDIELIEAMEAYKPALYQLDGLESIDIGISLARMRRTLRGGTNGEPVRPEDLGVTLYFKSPKAMQRAAGEVDRIMAGSGIPYECAASCVDVLGL